MNKLLILQVNYIKSNTRLTLQSWLIVYPWQHLLHTVLTHLLIVSNRGHRDYGTVESLVLQQIIWGPLSGGRGGGYLLIQLSSHHPHVHMISFRQTCAQIAKRQFEDKWNSKRVEFIPVEWRTWLSLDKGMWMNILYSLDNRPTSTISPPPILTSISEDTLGGPVNEVFI